MHIENLYTNQNPYKNMPAPNNMNPVRTFTTVENLLCEINSKIKQGKVTKCDAFSMLLAFINERCPKEKELDCGMPVLVFDQYLWTVYVKNRVEDILTALHIIEIGEDFFYLGFETGMWRAPVKEGKAQAKEAALDLASMAGISSDEMKMRFPNLVNWINEENDKDTSEPADEPWKKNFVPLYDQNTHLFFDIRLGLSNLNHDPEVIKEYVRLLRPTTGKDTENKTFIQYRNWEIAQALIDSQLVNIIDLNQIDANRSIITYTCPVKSENNEPLMAVPVFPTNLIRKEK